jgi:hypothetical protein
MQTLDGLARRQALPGQLTEGRADEHSQTTDLAYG